MTFFATSMKYVKGAPLDKSTMAKSSKQKFAHVYEGERDFQNHEETGPRGDGGIFPGFALATDLV